MKLPVFKTLADLRAAFTKGGRGAYLGDLPPGFKQGDAITGESRESNMRHADKKELGELRQKLANLQLSEMTLRNESKKKAELIENQGKRLEEIEESMAILLLFQLEASAQVNNLIAGKAATRLEMPDRKERQELYAAMEKRFGGLRKK